MARLVVLVPVRPSLDLIPFAYHFLPLALDSHVLVSWIRFLGVCFCCKSKRREEDDIDLDYEATMPTQKSATGRGSSNPYTQSSRLSQTMDPYSGREGPPVNNGKGNGRANGPTSVVENAM